MIDPTAIRATRAGGAGERAAGASRGAGQVLRRVGRTLAFTALSLGAAFGLWQGVLDLLNLNPYFAKGPLDVYDFLFTGASAGAARATLVAALLTTLRDAGLGFVAGTIAAVAVAAGVVLRSGVEQTLMPVAIALRSVPLVAMTPLLTLVFGQGLLAVTIIAGIVTFFPSLVNIVHGLRSVPTHSVDLLAAYGASELTTLRKLQAPYALPSLFVAARIAAPGALLGAVLAEWLATGKGLGALMVTSSATSQYDMLWASVVVITVVSVLVYNSVSTVEAPVVARFGAVGSR
ncbi:MAG TPA: ABC transporter permease subunit [Acidimicrobiales bacterium]|nr:ABC transporter permease subunit [Acidimicrobiales bacterium]